MSLKPEADHGSTSSSIEEHPAPFEDGLHLEGDLALGEGAAPVPDRPAEPKVPKKSPPVRTGVRGRFPWLFRRGWVFVVVTALVVAVAVSLSAGKQETYSSDAILLVNPGASSTSPGSANDAQALAATYAGLIPNDGAVLNAVSAVTGLSQDAVKRDTTVTVVNGTSLLDVRFTTTSALSASVGAAYISSAISGQHPVTKAIPTGTISVIHSASAVTKHKTKLYEVIALGILLGLLLAATIVIIWERADPRLDRPSQITGMLGIPARSLGGLNPDSADALVNRWKELAFSTAPSVALVSAVPNMGSSMALAADRLQSLTPGLKLIPAGAPGVEGGEAEAQQADLAVLVVPRESRVQSVVQARDLLEQFGVKSAWALMVNPRRS